MAKVEAAPLNSNFMFVGLIGLLISAFYLYPRSAPWGFTLSLFFAIMIGASLVSMTYAPPVEYDITRRSKKKKKK